MKFRFLVFTARVLRRENLFRWPLCALAQDMPKPELYVIYTGDRKSVPDTITLRREFFGGEKMAIDVEVNVLYQENETDIIGQYIIFCKVYNEQRKRYGNTKQAVTETIQICKNRNVLKEYLEREEQEVVGIMMTLIV